MIIGNNLRIKHLEKVGFPLMIFPIFYFDDWWINNIEPKLISLLGICLIIFSNNKKTYLSKFLSLKILSVIGLSSYSVYLLHQPIFAFYRAYVNKSKYIYFEEFSSKIDILKFDASISKQSIDLGPKLLIILITLLLGYFSYKKIELSIHKLKIINTFLILSLIFGIIQSQKPSVLIENLRSGDPITSETWASDYDCIRRFESFYDQMQIFDDCYINNSKIQTLVVIGDSSSAAIAKNFIKFNPLSDFNYMFITMNHRSFYEKYEDCNDCVLDWLRNNKENIKILLSLEIQSCIEDFPSIYYSDCSVTNNRDNLYNNFELFTKLSNEVIFVEPFPTMLPEKVEPKDILTTISGSKAEEIYISLTDWQMYTTTTYQFLEKTEQNLQNFSILSTRELFCDTVKCYVYKGSELYYVDAVHLSTEGAQKIVEKLINNLRKAN